MRNCGLGTVALVLATFPFNVQSYTVAYDFSAISDYGSAGVGAPPLPDAISNATQWEVLGSIVFSDDGREFDDYQVVGGSLSVNGISMGTFTQADYGQGYSDEPPEPGDDPYYANFSIGFNSEEFGPSSFSIFSEDFSGGESYSTAMSFLDAYPVGGYQSIQVTIGEWPNAFEVFLLDGIDSGFVPREVVAEVPEPSTVPLFAFGAAFMLWVSRRRIART
jgi:hypothetical protein